MSDDLEDKGYVQRPSTWRPSKPSFSKSRIFDKSQSRPENVGRFVDAPKASTSSPETPATPEERFPFAAYLCAILDDVGAESPDLKRWRAFYPRVSDDAIMEVWGAWRAERFDEAAALLQAAMSRP